MLLPFLALLGVSANPNYQPGQRGPAGSAIAIMEDLAHRAVKFFWEQSEPSTGFTKDRASNYQDGDTHTIASSASVGFALSAYVVGTEHHWLTRDQAKARTLLTLQHMWSQWPQEHGWFYHFVDWKTGERQWKCESSSIDTSIFLAGMQVADRYWRDPKITALAKAIEKRIDWSWMLTDGGTKPNEKFLCMGWHPESGFISARWSSFCELEMIYIQAHGFYDGMPPNSWTDVTRPIVNDRGFTFVAGGPLFFAQMTPAFFDVKDKRDAAGVDYWLNGRTHTLEQIAFAKDNPNHFKGYSEHLWGLSASDQPDGYGANGTPAPPEPDNGTLMPTAALGSWEYAKPEVEDYLTTILRVHPEYLGKYGFCNGFNETKDWHSPDVIGIDLGMFLSAWDAGTQGIIHKLTNSDPVVQKGFERMGFKSVKTNLNDPVIVGK
jgi:hypothetical protein